jgi:hypothetical protein
VSDAVFVNPPPLKATAERTGEAEVGDASVMKAWVSVALASVVR